MQEKQSSVAPFLYAYDLRQDEDSITVTFCVPEGTTTQDLDIKLDTNKIKAGLKGQPPVIEGTFFDTLESTIWAVEKNSVSLYLDLNEEGRDRTWPLLIKDVRDTSNPESIDPQSLYYCALYEERFRDRDRAFLLMEWAAERGSLDAQYEIAKRYAEGKKDEVKAIEFMTMAATRGHPEACLHLAEAYEKGTGGVTKSTEEAIKWYKHLSGPGADLRIGTLYMELNQPHNAKDFFYRAIDSDAAYYAMIPTEFRRWEAKNTTGMARPRDDFKLPPEFPTTSTTGATTTTLPAVDWRTLWSVAVVGLVAVALGRAVYSSLQK